MEAVLGSVSTSPILKLAFKSLFVGLLIFYLRGSGFELPAVTLFFAVFALFYLRPAIGSLGFSASALAFLFITFSLPYLRSYEAYFSLISGFLFFLLMGVKNFVLARPKDFYYFLHFSEIIALSALFLSGTLNPLIVFLLFLLLFREFYSFVGNFAGRAVLLIGAVEALMLLEILWLVSYLPMRILSGAGLSTILVFTFHDLTLHYLSKTLSRDLILRNVTIIISLVIFVLVLSRWTA